MISNCKVEKAAIQLCFNNHWNVNIAGRIAQFAYELCQIANKEGIIEGLAMAEDEVRDMISVLRKKFSAEFIAEALMETEKCE